MLEAEREIWRRSTGICQPFTAQAVPASVPCQLLYLSDFLLDICGDKKRKEGRRTEGERPSATGENHWCHTNVSDLQSLENLPSCHCTKFRLDPSESRFLSRFSYQPISAVSQVVEIRQRKPYSCYRDKSWKAALRSPNSLVLCGQIIYNSSFSGAQKKGAGGLFLWCVAQHR